MILEFKYRAIVVKVIFVVAILRMVIILNVCHVIVPGLEVIVTLLIIRLAIIIIWWSPILVSGNLRKNGAYGMGKMEGSAPWSSPCDFLHAFG